MRGVNMIKHVDDANVSSLFGNKRLFVIPKYQRAYTWGKREWNQLFEDVTENDIGYFLGSIICVNDVSMGANKYELIDGQQRLTTMSILLLAIYSKLKEMKDYFIDDEELLTDYSNLRREFFETNVDAKGKKTYIPRLQLQIQNANKTDYECLLYDHEIPIIVGEKAKYFGLRSIYKAFYHFQYCIEEYIGDKTSEERIKILFQLVDKFNSAVLVTIEVDSHKDAYMLFESLNNRGIPLSAIDLIKNILIRESEVNNETDETYEMWKQVLNNLGDNYSVEERFFRHYYNAFRERLNEPYKGKSNKLYELGYLATRTTILEIYEKMIKDQGYKKFLKDLLVSSQYYAVIINREDNGSIYKEDLENLERIQGAPSYLLLLYLFEYQKELQLSNEDLCMIVRLLVKFFVRRNITDIPGTRDLTKIFMEIIKGVNGLVGHEVYNVIKRELINCSSDEVFFESKLRGPIYTDNDMATRFILCQLEKQHQTKEIYSDFWKRDNNNKYVWTIEHIFPEGNNIPQAWVDMIADGDKILAQEYLTKYVHTLGNLTLTGYNQNLSNLSFEKKKNRINKDGKDIGYKNGLKLNDYVVLQDKWTIENIQIRTDNLVFKVLDLFNLEK